jgi:DNA polymerase III epsilon subunit-like protein
MPTSIAWGKLPPSSIRNELRSIDPNPADEKLTTAEQKALSTKDQTRVDELYGKLRDAGLVRGRTVRVSNGGKNVGSMTAGDEKRKLSEIATIVSDGNIVEPLFPDSLVASGAKGNYNDAMLETIRNAKKFVVVEGYEIDREDVVNLLIKQARAGLQVVVVIDPADSKEEFTKAQLIKKMRDEQLPNLQVAEYATLNGDKGSLDQILHVKKVIADTPAGSVVEVSGGINFNSNSIKNIDSGWRTEGVAALDSLDQVLHHFEKTTGAMPFDLSIVTGAKAVRAATAARAKADGLELVTVEMGAAGRMAIEVPRDYSQKKLLTRAKLGQKIVLSSKVLGDKGVEAALRQAAINGSQVQVIEEAMSPAEADILKKMKSELKQLGVAVLPAHAVVKDDSYQQLVYREMKAAIAAKESIEVAAFALSDKKIIDLLLEGAAAGCPVRVLVDDLTIDGMSINKKALAVLTTAGVAIRVLDRKAKEVLAAAIGNRPEELKLHAKIMVLGGNRVLGGSANFSKNGLTNNIEDGRLVRSASVAKAYKEILFDRIWNTATQPAKIELVEDANRVSLISPVKMSSKITDLVFVVFDTETTGFVPSHDERILGISAQAMKIKPDGSTEVISVLNRYVTPGTDMFGKEFEIPASTTKVHGLDKTTLAQKGAVPMRQAMPEFIKFVQDAQKQGPAILVGQNVPYDLRFIDYVMSRKELGVKEGEKMTHFRFDAPYVDTVDVSWKLFPKEVQHDLDALMTRLEIKPDPTLPRHDAYGDVVYTAQALAKLVTKGGLKTLGELMGDDILQVLGPTLVTSQAGGPAVSQLEFDANNKLVVRHKDAKSGQYGEPKRVNLLEVKGASGDKIEVAVVTGRGKTEHILRGYVDASKVEFRAPGKVFFELRENGVGLAKPRVLCTPKGGSTSAAAQKGA